MRKFIRFAFVGYFTPENIPNRKIRRAALVGVYSAAFFRMRAAYLKHKIDIMGELGKSELSFRDVLRYNDFHATADLIDIIYGDELTHHGRPPLNTSECGPGDDVCERDPHSGEILMCAWDYDRANKLSLNPEDFDHPTVAEGTTPADYDLQDGRIIRPS